MTVVERPWLKMYDAAVMRQDMDYYPQQPLFHFLRQAAGRYPQQVALRFGKATLRYAVLEQLTQRLADGLVQAGVRPGERVGVMMPNLPQFVLSYYAVLKAGGVVVACNPA